MSRVFRILVAGALLSAALPAAAYIRETTEFKNPSGGTCLWWGTRDVPYQVNAEGVSAAGTPSCATPADAEAATSIAMSTWAGATRPLGTSPCTDFSFEPAQAPTTSLRTIGNDGVNLVVFRKGACTGSQTPAANNCWPYDDPRMPGEDSTIAITHTFYDAHTGQIFDADVEIFASDAAGSGKDLSCGGAVGAVDVQSVVVHEAGHMLGLDHVCTNEFGPGYNTPAFCLSGAAKLEVMAPQVGGAGHRTLQPDDVEGVCKIYPKDGVTAICPPVGNNSGGGCTSAGGAGIAALLLALLPVARLRRRARR